MLGDGAALAIFPHPDFLIRMRLVRRGNGTDPCRAPFGVSGPSLLEAAMPGRLAVADLVVGRALAHAAAPISAARSLNGRSDIACRACWPVRTCQRRIAVST